MLLADKELSKDIAKTVPDSQPRSTEEWVASWAPGQKLKTVKVWQTTGVYIKEKTYNKFMGSSGTR